MNHLKHFWHRVRKVMPYILILIYLLITSRQSIKDKLFLLGMSQN